VDTRQRINDALHFTIFSHVLCTNVVAPIYFFGFDGCAKFSFTEASIELKNKNEITAHLSHKVPEQSG
jgi:hypothetical protein